MITYKLSLDILAAKSCIHVAHCWGMKKTTLHSSENWRKQLYVKNNEYINDNP